MPDPRSVAERLTAEFRAAFGEELRSVVLFGSVARGEAIPGVSDVNILVLLDAVTPTELAKVAPLAQGWVRSGNTPPLTFSMDEWAGMGDTFAVEISDMLDAREVIHGSDPLSGDGLDPADLRLHAEQEIRQTMLQLRLRMLLSVGDPLELGHLLLSGLPSFGSFMRAALRLSGETAPNETERVIEAAGALIGADPGAMLGCQEARRAMRVPDVTIRDPLVAGYTSFAERLVDYIDRLPAAPRGQESPGFRSPTVAEGSR